MCHMSYQWCLRAEFLMCPPQLHQGLGGHPCSCQGFHHPNPTKFEPDHLHTMLYHSTSSSPPSGWPHVLHNFIKYLEDIHVLDRVSIIQILPNLNQIISILCSIIQHPHHHHQDDPTSSTTSSSTWRTSMFLTGSPSSKSYQFWTRSPPYYAQQYLHFFSPYSECIICHHHQLAA